MSPIEDDDTVPQHLLDEHGNRKTSGFTPGDILLHVSTRRIYLVLQMPLYAVNESTGEPCYCLREMSQGTTPPDPRWLFWSQAEVDDGRFHLHSRRVDS